MKNNGCVIAIVLDFLKILFKDENKNVLDFLDFYKKILKSKFEKTKETEETEDTLDIIAKRIQENEEERKNSENFY